MGIQLEEEDERTVFLDAIEESLRPLMRAVYEYGISYQDLIGVVRALYVFSVRDKCLVEGRPISESRLGLIAGVTRNEIVRIIEDRKRRDEQRALAAKRLDQISQILGKWHDDPNFSTPYGAPIDLSLSVEGSFRTFDELLEVAETGLDRDTAIAVLVANRCAEIKSERFIRCTTRAYQPLGKNLSKIARLGRLGSALHSTFSHNLFRSPDVPSYFDRTMVSDFPLSTYGREAMLAQLKVDGQEFIDGMDRWVANKATGYRDEIEGRRYGVTALFFEDAPKSQVTKSIIKVSLTESSASD